MSNIRIIDTAPEPLGDLVETIERLLVSAKAGELQGFAFVATGMDRITLDWAGSAGTRNSIAMGIMMLHTRYAQAVLDD